MTEISNHTAEAGAQPPDDKLVVFMVDESQDAYERLRDVLAAYSKEIMREVILIQAPNTIDMWEKYLRYKQEYPIDVVLMDYRLPMVQLTAQGAPQYVTGVTCIRQLREEGGYTGPIVGFAADREEN